MSVQQDIKDLQGNPFDILGLPVESTLAQIQSAYRKKALVLHPDKNKNDPDASTKFQHLKRVFEYLKNEEKRTQLVNFLQNQQKRQFERKQGNSNLERLREELRQREAAFQKEKEMSVDLIEEIRRINREMLRAEQLRFDEELLKFHSRVAEAVSKTRGEEVSEEDVAASQIQFESLSVGEVMKAFKVTSHAAANSAFCRSVASLLASLKPSLGENFVIDIDSSAEEKSADGEGESKSKRGVHFVVVATLRDRQTVLETALRVRNILKGVKTDDTDGDVTITGSPSPAPSSWLHRAGLVLPSSEKERATTSRSAASAADAILLEDSDEDMKNTTTDAAAAVPMKQSTPGGWVADDNVPLRASIPRVADPLLGGLMRDMRQVDAQVQRAREAKAGQVMTVDLDADEPQLWSGASDELTAQTATWGHLSTLPAHHRRIVASNFDAFEEWVLKRLETEGLPDAFFAATN